MADKKNELKPKDAKLLRLHLQGKKHKEIAKALGRKNKDRNSAEASVSNSLRRIKAHDLGYLLNRYGATDKAVITTAVAGLKAMETKFATFEGRITDHEDVISHGIRLKSAELLGKWKQWEKVTLQNPDGTALRFAQAEEALAKVYGDKK